METGSDPESMAEYFLVGDDGNPTEMELGDSLHRMDDSATIVAKNSESNRLKVTKQWRGVPDTTGFPSVKFTLYQAWASNPTDGWPYVKGAERRPASGTAGTYTDIELSDGMWTWTCPEDLPETLRDNNNQPQDVVYYAKETPGSGSVGNTTWEFYCYTSDNGTPSDTSDDKTYNALDGGGRAGIPGKNLGTDGGTFTIVNKVGKYIQMDIKKQFESLNDDGAWENTTAGGQSKSTVLGFTVIRAVRDAAGNWLDEAGNVAAEPVWSDFGDEILCGYDENGNPVVKNGGSNDFFVESASSNPGGWHFRIRDEQGGANNIQNDKVGLPASGFYVKDGKTVSVTYVYSYRETGVYADTDRTPYEGWSWFSSLTPARAYDANGEQEFWTDSAGGQHAYFHKMSALQDADRIVNFQASDITPVKNWGGGPHVHED